VSDPRRGSLHPKGSIVKTRTVLVLAAVTAALSVAAGPATAMRQPAPSLPSTSTAPATVEPTPYIVRFTGDGKVSMIRDVRSALAAGSSRGRAK
jgi:hypothetical protein